MIAQRSHVCEIGALHVEGVVRAHGQYVSHVDWVNPRAHGYPDWSFVPNDHLVEWDKREYEAPVQRQPDMPLVEAKPWVKASIEAAQANTPATPNLLSFFDATE